MFVPVVICMFCIFLQPFCWCLACGFHFLSPPTPYLSLCLYCCCLLLLLLFCVVLFSCFFCISLSVLFWEGDREVLCVVLWCVSLLVGVASYVGINLLSLLNNTYWCYFISLQQPCLVLYSWIWLHWPLSLVSPRKPLMMNQMVWICWLYSNKPQQIWWLY